MLDRLYFNHDGRGFRCWVDTGGSSIADVNIHKAWWVVEVAGTATRAFPARPDDTEGRVRREVVRWYNKGLSKV